MAAGANAAKRSAWKGWLGALALACVAFVGWEWVRLPDATELKDHYPSTTALQQQRAEEARSHGKKVRRKEVWVPLSAVSKVAVAAVVISEDASFYQHGGIDVEELRKALGQAWHKGALGRGASTLTQQLAKNLWLSTDRSLLRKVKELILAKRLEAALSKARILTLYLNLVEWGDGVYGIEAAAMEHFGVHANQLTPAQGAMLASMLPAPRRRLPRLKPRALQRHALLIINRLAAVNRLTPEQAAQAREELARFFGRSEAPASEEELLAPSEAETDPPPEDASSDPGQPPP